MATKLKYDALSAVQTLITSGADLADGSGLLSSAYDNATNQYLFGDFEMYLPNGLGATISAQKAVELYLLPQVDQANFADPTSGGALADTLVPLNCYAGSFMVRAEASAATAQRLALRGIPLPATQFKAFIRNKVGQSLKDGATHFTLKMTAYDLQQA